MHGLDVIILKNAKTAGRAAGHKVADAGGSTQALVVNILVEHSVFDYSGPLKRADLINRAFMDGYAAGLQE